jgi:hypothetical protein
MLGEVSGSYLFDRRARLTVGTLEVQSEGSEALRITFSATRTLKREANRARIQVFNLSPDTRARIEGEQRRVILEAGYAKTMAAIFIGDRAFISSARDGTDWVTTIDASDGRTLSDQQVKISFEGQVSAKQITDALIGLMQQQGVNLKGRKVQGGAGIEAALGRLVYQGGKTVNGKIGDILGDLAEDLGVDVSIQSGQIVMLNGEQALNAPGLELSPGSGLIDSPVRIKDPKRPKKLLLQGESLLIPGISPGRRLVLSSSEHKGTFKTIKAVHNGDTHGPDKSWLTRWEAESYP